MVASRWFPVSQITVASSALAGVLAAAVVCTSAVAAEPAAKPAPPAAPEAVDNQDFSAELPRLAPVEPADAIKTFQLKSEVRIEQVVAEPLIASPVAVAWDENCNLYVCEMRGYSEKRDEKLSRIRCLHDDNGDGRYDRAEVFADNLLWPTALACWDGGLFVGDAPNIYYLKDTDGDGRADRREVVYTGFAVTNVQGLLNTFLWTFDNRIHGSASSTGGEITRPDDPKFKALNLRGRDFDFDPRTRDIRATSGGAQHGMSFDNFGTKFVSSNSDHIQQVMFEDRYASRNPYLSVPSARVSVAADGPQAEVYRASPVEPWRVVRTRLRVSGAVKGAVEGGGRAAGYFTGATGVTIYRGSILPPEFAGLAIVADVGSNLVHRKRLSLEGLQYKAERMDQQSELLTSTDIWFRPVQFTNGPEGALYVIDMYREMIEHPGSIPEVIKKHLDTSSGQDRGRLYRIVPPGFKPGPLPKLGKATTNELVNLLAHKNAWHRETAARLLYERQDKQASLMIIASLFVSEDPVYSIQGMYTLAGLDRLDPFILISGMINKNEHVRRHAIRLSEAKFAKSPELAAAILKLVDDPSMLVRYQLAFTLGYLPATERRGPLTQLAKRDGGDRWMRVAIQSSLADDAAPVLADLLADAEVRQSTAIRPLLISLATQVSRRNRADEVALVANALKAVPAGELAIGKVIARGMMDGRGGEARRQLFGSDGSTPLIDMRSTLAAASTTALDAKLALAKRTEAISWFSMGELSAALAIAPQLLDSKQPAEVQLAMISALDEFREGEVARPVIAQWSALSPRVKSAALDMLMTRSDRVGLLLDAVEAEQFPAHEIDPAHAARLMSGNDPRKRPKAQQLLSATKVARRQDVVDAYRGVLKMSGDPARGKLVFGKICATCHRAENVGFEIGPNLSTMKSRGPEAILLNVLDPSREVNPQFVNYVCLTTDGRSLAGMLASETATSVTLKRAENQQDTVLRIDIDELRGTGASIMPEGLEKQIDQQSMADVIAYIMQLP
ncbi:MAG: c-type cytochrome [Planctomycetes bacterium]|nr:c-type cytochrome [Planctomycetota bacterium]